MSFHMVCSWFDDHLQHLTEEQRRTVREADVALSVARYGTFETICEGLLQSVSSLPVLALYRAESYRKRGLYYAEAAILLEALQTLQQDDEKGFNNFRILFRARLALAEVQKTGNVSRGLDAAYTLRHDLNIESLDHLTDTEVCARTFSLLVLTLS